MALALFTCPLVHGGCEPVDGGAVEASWELRRSDGQGGQEDCDQLHVEYVRLWWDTGDMRRFDRFICSEDTGVTRFDLPPGPVDLWLEPECVAGFTAEGRFRVPAPIVREVTSGEVITLDTQLIEVDQTRDTGCPGADGCLCRALNDGAAARVDPSAVPGLEPPRLRVP